ncbi:MAG: TonB-dependent receptor [Verrucomicrobiota bacterium]
MSRTVLGTHQKALQCNLDPTTYGTFAEIGAGQEVARWFFMVGGAAGTVAKTISAYDMAFSDAIYGASERYVSRQRLATMLDHEYALLLERLDSKRGPETKFFVFADTVAARSYKGTGECHGWMGVRFQHAPRAEPSQIIIHVRMLDRENVSQQAALGIMGVNLIYGACYFNQDPETLLLSLMDNLTYERVELDVIKFSGPAFRQVDNRIMSLHLVKNWFTEAAMFTANGEVVQASEVLYKQPVLVERGTFRPVTRTTMNMLECAQTQFLREPVVQGHEVVVLMEMTLRSLSKEGGVIDHRDFLDRVDVLGALGKTVLISNYLRYFKLAEYLSRYTKNITAIAMGVPSLVDLFEEKYYTDTKGGILEALGRMFHHDLKVYLYPAHNPKTGELVTASTFRAESHLQHLYAYLRDKGCITDLQGYDASCLSISSREVLRLIQAGDHTWETMVPPLVAKMVKARKLFGYRVAG